MDLPFPSGPRRFAEQKYQQVDGSYNDNFIEMTSYPNDTKSAAIIREQKFTSSTSYEPLYEDGAQQPRGLAGWRISGAFCAFGALVVFLLNTVALIFFGRENVDGIATIFQGSCSRTRYLSAGLHIFINIVSTILLTSSNYCMQCLVAPTRKDIDLAHSRRKRLDIGVHGLRNLTSIGGKRFLLWLSLFLSSLPLHLMYNSAVFESTSANDYLAVLATSDFTTSQFDSLGYEYGVDAFIDEFNDGRDDAPIIESLHNSSASLDRLTNEECITAYAQTFVSARRNVLLISNVTNDNYTVLRTFSTELEILKANPFSWICSGAPYCSATSALALASAWSVAGDSRFVGPHLPPDIYIQYCLSESTEERCEVNMSVVIMMIVVGANFIKFICMLLTIWPSDFTPLVTVGDAIASFLDRPDPTTSGHCLLSERDIRRKGWSADSEPKIWRPRRTRWFVAASTRRWFMSGFLCISIWIAACVLLSMAAQILAYDSISIWQVGFGVANTAEIWNMFDQNSLIPNILISNFFQVLVTFAYFSYNGLYTCMLLCKEWSNFASQRKHLRVTSPVGTQRKTFFLSLPYRYAIPLMVASGTLHWLISQSIFLIQVRVYSRFGEISSSISTVGYSALAIVCTLILGGVMILTIFFTGFRSYNPNMPLVSSCSVAISAACHPLPDEREIQLRALQWGVVSEGADVDHASFSSGVVLPLVAGRKYA